MHPTMTRPTIADVARAAGVSPTLVSFALNQRPGVAADTRDRIVAAARALGYVANPLAQSLRTGRTGTVGMVVRNYTNPYFLDLIAGAQQHAWSEGATVLAVDSDYSEQREHEHIARLASTHADGLAIAPVGDGAGIAQWQQQRPGTPVVMVNAALQRDHQVMRVGPDNPRAVHLAVSHLHQLGHRRIAFLMAPSNVQADHDRSRTFATAVGRMNLEGVPVETPLSIDGTLKATADLLAHSNPPTAVITNSDHTAHAVYFAARQAGVAVGHHLSVVGHDDLPTSALLDPPLTTVRLDRWAVGQAIAQRLIGQAQGDYVAPVTLVVRGSTGPPASTTG